MSSALNSRAFQSRRSGRRCAFGRTARRPASGRWCWRCSRFYRPKTHTATLDTLPLETRFREELGIDSLTLTEMVFKLDELLGVTIELREVAHVQTLGELQEFLRGKLEG